MARNYEELRAKMRPEARARVEARVKETLKNMPLEELRSAREMTQVNLAKVLGVQQASISKMERRTDMYLSTLRSYVEAMGGRLELRAVFQDGAVNLDLTKE
jgi:DNA-binding XRE family transcriptional regulator